MHNQTVTPKTKCETVSKCFKIHMKNNLNSNQKEAIEYFSSPLLIIAGAGSGKTMVITHKIAHMIETGLFAPEQILAITFTNKAAKEMKQRVETLVKESSIQPFIGTFHAFCGYILRHEFHHLNRNNHFVIYDSNDQKQVISIVMKRLNINPDTINPSKAQNIISLLKNDLINVDKYIQIKSQYFYESEIADIYKYYQEYLAENNAIDFDDMIFCAVQLFQQHPEVLAHYQNQFRYLLVDEFQDTNIAQYTLIKLLSGQHQNICVVGDFDQNIYSWRGANIQNILNFEKNFKKAKIILLEQNYRSTKFILDAANGLIQKNVTRKEKNLWTDNQPGDPLYFYVAYNERDEAEFVASEIPKICKKHQTSLNNCAILYRTNAQSRIFEDVFNRTKIPYRLVGGVGFYSRKEIKDMIAYLRLVFNPNDNTAFLRVINLPTRGIGDVTCDRMLNASQEHKKSIYELFQEQKITASKEQLKTIDSFFNLIITMQNLYETAPKNKLSILISSIIEQSGYKASLEKENTLTSLERLENILELKTITQEEDISLENFLLQVSLMSDLDQPKETNTQNAITLMTLHNAKGLEFDVIFLVGMEEGLLPHYKTQFDPNAVEEERRLCYVGITRGKKQVYLSSANQRSIFGDVWYNDISRFIKEIPFSTFSTFVSEQLLLIEEVALKKLKDAGLTYKVRDLSDVHIKQKNASPKETINFQVGTIIEHKIWGKGKIIKIEGEGDNSFIFISFNNEIKKLMTKYAPVSKVSETM